MHRTFILENITPREYSEESGERFEIIPAGYIVFSSLWQYKKMEKLERITSYFLKRLPEIEYKNNKVFECLDKIETLVDICGKVSITTNFEETFDVAFPAIVKFIKKVGLAYEKKDKICDVGKNIWFDCVMDDKVRHKYCVTVHRLFDQGIWPFEIFNIT